MLDGKIYKKKRGRGGAMAPIVVPRSSLNQENDEDKGADLDEDQEEGL